MAHLLIVEDEPSTSWALAEGLSEDGFTTDTFRSAEEALVWLATGASDLVITDLRLPGMSGLDLARKLRKGKNAQPVIVLTIDASPQTLSELRGAGVAESFSKPFPLDALRRAVRRALADVPSTRRGQARRAA